MEGESVDKDELREKIKRQEKEIELLKKQYHQLKEKVENGENEEENEELNEDISRRKFLKLAGLGAGGLALSSTGASWYSVSGGNSSSSQTLDEVLTEGNDISGKDIVDGSTTVWDSTNNYIPREAIETSSTSDSYAQIVPMNYRKVGMNQGNSDTVEYSLDSNLAPIEVVRGTFYLDNHGGGGTTNTIELQDSNNNWNQVYQGTQDDGGAYRTFSVSNVECKKVRVNINNTDLLNGVSSFVNVSLSYKEI